MKYFLILPILLTIQGCVYFNEEGISTKRYRDCIEYYDIQGKYRCECDENLIDYDQMDDKLLKGDK
ncbi:hypothetical protein NNO_1538 [Hydrogenimonas sp.]|nr:hypothetical protein NNO_1538 [Hydrogenimonas sp.]